MPGRVPRLGSIALFLMVGGSLAAFPLESATSQSSTSDDPAFARSQMEIGQHILTGRPGVTRKAMDQRGRVKGGRERVYTHDEVVFLFPLTPKVEVAVSRFGGNSTAIATELGSAARFRARTFTDDRGYFRFRGLKPGRYLLMVAVPYIAATRTKEETGEVRTSMQYTYDRWFITSATAVSEPVYRYRNSTTALEHRIVRIVEIRPDRTETALGEIE